MGKRSRDKGKRGEREWRDFLREHFNCPEAIRGRQYQGGDDSPDVRNGIHGTHVEVKRVEALRVHDAVQQAVEDAQDGEVPYVAYKKNRRPWLIVVRAEDLYGLSLAVCRQMMRERGYLTEDEARQMDCPFPPEPGYS